MRPPWPRLALRSLVRGGPAGPGWPRQEWPGVAKLLIQSHFVSFPVVCAGRPSARQGSHRAFLWKVFVFGHFCRYPTSGARGFSGVAKSGGPPIPWPDLARFTPRDLRSKPGMRGSRLHGNDGGVANSGKTFNSVAFGCISLHFLSSEPSPLPGFQPSLE